MAIVGGYRPIPAVWPSVRFRPYCSMQASPICRMEASSINDAKTVAALPSVIGFKRERMAVMTKANWAKKVEITDAGLDPACSSFDAMYAIGPVATPNVHRSNATGAAVVAPGWLVKNANTPRHQIHKAALVYRSPSTRNGHAST